MTETATRYTEQQIEAYCKHADDGEAVEIIKQLQEEVANYSVYGKMPEAGETISTHPLSGKRTRGKQE